MRETFQGAFNKSCFAREMRETLITMILEKVNKKSSVADVGRPIPLITADCQILVKAIPLLIGKHILRHSSGSARAGGELISFTQFQECVCILSIKDNRQDKAGIAGG